MSPRRCEACDSGTGGFLCLDCIRLLPQHLIDLLNHTARSLTEAQDKAVAHLRRLRGAR